MSMTVKNVRHGEPKPPEHTLSNPKADGKALSGEFCYPRVENGPTPDHHDQIGRKPSR